MQNSPRSRLARAPNRALAPPCSALFLLLLVAACQININGVPLAVDHDEPDDDRRDSAVAIDDSDDEVTPSDADVEGSDGSTTRDGGEDGATTEPGLPHHPSCAWPNVETDLKAVLVPTDARGRPSFDWWRDVACEATNDYETCTSELNGRSRECDQCIRGDSSAVIGLCIGPDGPETCTGHDIAIELSPRGCLVCADPRLRRHACCNQIAGFDCRSWPYPGNSAVGGLCARHADCESGLMCKTLDGWRFGTCTCPEVNGPSYAECHPWTPADDS